MSVSSTSTATLDRTIARSRVPANPWGLIRRALVYVLLSVAAFVSIFPFYWMVVGASNTSADIIKGKSSIGSALITNASAFFAQVDALRIFWNSGVIAVVATVLT
ncbi:MAG: carbohydrate ABC transporter permease, partial [Proteobacteria bacterium]